MHVRNVALLSCLSLLHIQTLAHAEESDQEFTAMVIGIESCPGHIGLVDRSTTEFLCVSDKPGGVKINALIKHKGEDVRVDGKIESNPNQGWRTVRISRLNVEKIHGSHSFGFADALMIGALGVQGAAVGMQKNPALQQQQIAQIQAQQDVYQQQATITTYSSQTPNTNASRYIAGLPQCTHSDFSERDGAYWVTNSCGEAVDVKFTSQTGKMWGEGTVGAGQRQAMGMFGMSGSPNTNGMLWLYTCPLNTTAVQPDGKVFWSRSYRGSYVCAKQ